MSKNLIRLFYISVVILLFFGPGVLYSIGWTIDYDNAPFYQKLRPEFYILFFIFLVISRKKNNRILPALYILYLSAVTVVYWLITGQMNGLAVLINPLIIPAFIYAILNSSKNISKNTIFYIIITFYVINSFLAIYSSITRVNLFHIYMGGTFSSADEILELNLFRATALRNHPLGNALLTDIILAFIVVTDKINGYIKFALCLLGYISLMCFNARSSMMIVPALTSIYVAYCVFVLKAFRIKKFYLFIGIIVLFYVVSYLFGQGYGGRLLEEDNLEDSSVEARTLLFKWFFSADFSMFLFGMSVSQISRTVKLSHIESWIILYLMRMGIFIFSGFISLFYKLLKKCCKGQDKYLVLYVVLTTFIIASTNNSIYGGDPVLATFILCSYSMFPKIQKK